MRTLTEYVLDELAYFHAYPCSDEYDNGYFDGLAYLADYFGVLKIDKTENPKPSRPKLTLIQGGKK